MELLNLQDIRVDDWFCHLHGLGVLKIITVQIYCKCADRDNNFQEVNHKDLMPVPLSERVLELCGFDSNGILQLNENDVISYHPMQKTVGVVGFGYNACRLIPWKVEFLHQLQHIYRDLTGEELNPDMPALSREIEERMIKEELYG
jgi:hypothetical protein